MVGAILSTATVSGNLGLPSSRVLGSILALDAAESATAYIGQINLSVVSSFCGPADRIWGYDLARPDNLFASGRPFEHGGRRTMVYSINPLLEAMTALFGTVDARRFPLRPGSIVPCAACHLERSGPRRLYAALAIGVTQDRGRDACLLMEDVGELPLDGDPNSPQLALGVLDDLTKSVLLVGVRQRVEYREVFVGIREVKVAPGDIGCALVACPYFTLAQGAIPVGGIERMKDLSLSEWDATVAPFHARSPGSE